METIFHWAGLAPSAPLPLSPEHASATVAALRRFEAWFAALGPQNTPEGFLRLKFVKPTTATLGGKKDKQGGKKGKGGADAGAADGAQQEQQEQQQTVLRIYEDFTPLEPPEPRVADAAAAEPQTSAAAAVEAAASGAVLCRALPTFDAALDEYFSSAEMQRSVQQQQAQEQAALSKVYRIRADQAARAAALVRFVIIRTHKPQRISIQGTSI